jgi:phosphoesterase RecJ-like protein
MKNVVEALQKASDILLFPHIMMDGDTIGSCVALIIALRKMQKNALMCIDESIPYQYQFLINDDFIIRYDENSTLPHFDCSVAIDASDPERLGLRAAQFYKSPVTISIDHHKTNMKFASINHVAPGKAATAEIIFELIKKLGGEIDTLTASAIYVGILSDTGGFRFSNTTPQSHLIAAELLKTGIDVSAMSKIVFDEMSFSKLKLIARAIDSVEMHLQNRLAIMTLNEDDVRLTGSLPEDFNEIVNFGRNIRGVEVAVLIRTTEKDKTKVSIRTNKFFDASEIAALFSGGGHARAAGFNYSGEINPLKAKIIEIVKKGMKY